MCCVCWSDIHQLLCDLLEHDWEKRPAVETALLTASFEKVPCNAVNLSQPEVNRQFNLLRQVRMMPAFHPHENLQEIRGLDSLGARLETGMSKSRECFCVAEACIKTQEPTQTARHRLQVLSLSYHRVDM